MIYAESIVKLLVGEPKSDSNSSTGKSVKNTSGGLPFANIVKFKSERVLSIHSPFFKLVSDSATAVPIIKSNDLFPCGSRIVFSSRYNLTMTLDVYNFLSGGFNPVSIADEFGKKL